MKEKNKFNENFDFLKMTLHGTPRNAGPTHKNQNKKNSLETVEEKEICSYDSDLGKHSFDTYSTPICKSYIERKITNESILKKIDASTVLTPLIYGPTIIGGAVSLLALAKGLYSSTKASIIGCQNVTDPQERMICLAKEKRSLDSEKIAKLLEQKSKCVELKDQNQKFICEKKIDDYINDLNQTMLGAMQQ